MRETRLIREGVLKLGGIAPDHEAERTRTAQMPASERIARSDAPHPAIAALEASSRLNRYYENMGLPEL